MFSTFKSYFIFDMVMKPKTGFLVSQGNVPFDPSLPDISFMRTTINGVETLYIPGSSIKGPMRAFAESFLRSMTDDDKKEHFACYITDNKKNCSAEINKVKSKDNKALTPQQKYAYSCLACRTFGNTNIASVIRINDFYPFDEELLSDPDKLSETAAELSEMITVRPGIAVDRQTGKVKKGALFFYESVNFPFYGKIILKNPEKWQIGLLLKIIDATKNGILRFGRNKSRGLGWAELEIISLKVLSNGSNAISFTSFEKTEKSFEFLEEKFTPDKLGLKKCDDFYTLDSIETFKEFFLKNLEEWIKKAGNLRGDM